MNPFRSRWTLQCAQGVTLAAALVTAPLVAHAQASAEEQAVASVVEKLRVAMVDPDQATLTSLHCAQGVTLAAALVTAPLVAHAQASAEEQAVASVVEKLRVAMVDPDQATLTSLTSPLLSYGHSGGKVDTQASFIGALMDKSSDFVSISLSDQTISISGNVAVVRHTLAGATNDRGTPGNVTIKVLTIWQKDGGQWRLLARQAVRPA